MHSLPPIAGITCVSGSSVDAEARSVEARDRLAELRAAAVRRVLVRAGIARPRSAIASTMCAGRRHVGVADPERDHVDARRLASAAIFRSSSANRYGGIRLEALRSSSRAPPRAPPRTRPRTRPRYTGSAQPVRVTSSSSLTSTSSSPPSSAHRHRAAGAAQHRRDRRAGCAGPGRERLPHPALEDPRAHLAARSRSG